jgi:hypothetical protein
MIENYRQMEAGEPLGDGSLLFSASGHTTYFSTDLRKRFGWFIATEQSHAILYA